MIIQLGNFANRENQRHSHPTIVSYRILERPEHSIMTIQIYSEPDIRSIKMIHQCRFPVHLIYLWLHRAKVKSMI
jgi:hypothetical protein